MYRKLLSFAFSGLVSVSAACAAQINVDKLANDVEPDVIKWRHHFHEFPELSNREFKTAEYVADYLTSLGLDVQTGVAKTGVVAILDSGNPGPVVALRADMDGLPVKEQNDLTNVYLNLPYLGDISSKVKNSINTCLKQIKCNTIQLAVYNKYYKIGNSFAYKDPTPKTMKSGVVYKLSCSCSKVYIGETARNLITRCNEHLKTTGKTLTEVGRHLRDNPTHEINSYDPEILGYCRFSRKRKIMESLYIQQHEYPKELLNDNESSVKLYLFSVPTG